MLDQSLTYDHRRKSPREETAQALAGEALAGDPASLAGMVIRLSTKLPGGMTPSPPATPR
jgi:hypothetical protein